MTEAMEGFSTPKKQKPGSFSIASALQARGDGAAPTNQLVRLSLPWETRYGREKVAFALPDALGGDECDAIIRTCEEKGFEQALLNVGGGRQILADDVRKSGRCIVDDVDAAAILWGRLKHVLPGEYTDTGMRYVSRDAVWKCVGLNERFRVLKYEPGDYFAPHRDGSFERFRDSSGDGKEGDRSFFTLMLYLNAPAKGGGTNFLSVSGKSRTYDPNAGDALVFDHEIRHEGSLLEEGVKYAIRTDVMYRRKGG